MLNDSLICAAMPGATDVVVYFVSNLCGTIWYQIRQDSLLQLVAHLSIVVQLVSHLSVGWYSVQIIFQNSGTNLENLV